MISDLIKNFNRKEVKVKPYLEFKSSTPMTITPNYTNTGVTLQYSLDSKTWVTIAAKGVTPSSNVIYFRGSATGTKSLFTSNSPSNAWIFTGATNLEVNGNINTLIQDTLGGRVIDMSLGFCAFSNMFNGCTSLITPPELPSTTLDISCYYNMFYKCTRLTTPPKLPSTTLASNCYTNMFGGCTSLTTVPELPTTKLAVSCYPNMFRGCTKIKLSTIKTGNYQTEYRIPKSGTGTTATNALTDMFTGTGGTFTGTPTINTTYYTENQVI